MDDMERNELLVRAGLSPLQPGELDIDAMLSALGPERSRKTWFLRKTLGWDEKRVADKLGIPFWDVRSDIKEAEKELQRLSGKTEIHELVQALNKRVDESKEHSDTVLHILEIYANQLEVSYEPEDFLTEPNSKVSNEKESDYWLYVRDIFPSIDRLIDRQMDSESLVITSPLDEEPTFALLEGHYKDTKLWEDISKCKQAMNTYVSAGLKLRKIVMSELCPLLQGIGQANLFLEGLREMVRAELAPVRVKVHLEGMLTDRVLEQLPDDKLLKQFHGFAIGFVNRYKNKVEVEDDSKNNVQEAQNKGEVILELLDKLVKNYELMKRLNKAIVRGVEEEKLKGMLPPGTKCKFCPPIRKIAV